MVLMSMEQTTKHDFLKNSKM